MSLGSIIVRLSMNTADFETDAGRASKVAQRRAKEIDDAFRKAGTAIGLALGAAMVGATAAIKRTIDNMDELSKSSQRVGLPTEEFSRLAYAGGLADVEVSTLVSTLGKLTKAQAAALNTTSSQAKVFDALGISIKDAEGNLRSSSAVLIDFADRFKQLDGSPEAMAAGFALFGRSFQDMIPLIKDGGDAIRQAGIESDQLGNTLSTSAGKAAEEFNDNLTRMQTAVGGAWQEIATGMLPQLNQMSGDLVEAAKHTDDLRNVGAGLMTMLEGVGKLFGIVSRMARQFGIDVATAAQVADGMREVSKNLNSFGMADGTVEAGTAKIRAALTQRKQMLDGFKRQDANASAEANIARLIAGGKGDGGGLPAGWFGKNDPAAEAAAMQKRLQAAFGPTASAGKKASGGKSDAQRQADEAARAAKQAEDAQRRWNGSILDMEASLAGPVAEAQREYQRNVQALNEDFNAGEVKLSDYAKALDLYAEKRDREIKSINDRKTPAQKMLEDMQFEITLIGKTREEQELLNAARYLGAEAATAQGQAALAAMKLSQETAEATGLQIERMDALRDSAKGLFSDIAHGANAWDAVASAFDRYFDKVFDMASSGLVDQLFGKSGTTQTGSDGGGFWSLLGSFFGGGKASGGWTMPRQINEVNERGFEMASVGGRDYMLTGNNPVHITPNHRLGGGGSTSITINNSIRGDVNARTSDQYAAKTAERLQRASRNR